MWKSWKEQESLLRKDLTVVDVVKALGISVLFAYFFYRSFWMIPLMLPVGMVYLYLSMTEHRRKRLQRERDQFKECILAVSTSLRAGYAVEGALSDALVYLETFAPAEKKVQFEERVQSLFETRWMIELVDSAMLKVREFPHNGNLYFDIISRCYLDKFKYTESDLLELLSMERSTYYDRKKEAIYVFGISLWGDALPKMMRFIEDVADEMKDMPEEVLCG